MSKASEWAKTEKVCLSKRMDAIAVAPWGEERSVILNGRFWVFTLTADEALKLGRWILDTFGEASA